jgi:hypothetical protein
VSIWQVNASSAPYENTATLSGCRFLVAFFAKKRTILVRCSNACTVSRSHATPGHDPVDPTPGTFDLDQTESVEVP